MTLQQIFILNLKKFRKIRGLSQMTLAEKCDTSANYIGQIEMGRRIPSFEKIEKIAYVLEVDSYRLFMQEAKETIEPKEPKAGEFLKLIPPKVKKEIISRLLADINRDVTAAFDANRYGI
jgi:transcriptional regulator with XRE-family HTH domain